MRKGYLALASLALLILVPGCKDKEKVKPRHIPRRPTAAKHEMAPQPTEAHTKALKKEDHIKKGYDGVINRNRRLKKETAKLASAGMSATTLTASQEPAKKEIKKQHKVKKERIKKEKKAKQPKAKKEKKQHHKHGKKHEASQVLTSAETPVTALAATQEPAKKHVRKQHKVKKEKVKKEKKAKQPKVKKERAKKEKKAKQPKAKKEKKQHHKHGKKHEASQVLASAETPVTALAATQEPAKKHVRKQHKVKKEKVKKEKKQHHKHGKKHKTKGKIALAAADVMPTALPTEMNAPEEQALPVAPEETTPMMKKPALEEQGIPTTASGEAMEKTITPEPEEPVISIEEEEEEDLLSAVPEMSTPAVTPAATEPMPMPVPTTEEKVSVRLIK